MAKMRTLLNFENEKEDDSWKQQGEQKDPNGIGGNLLLWAMDKGMIDPPENLDDSGLFTPPATRLKNGKIYQTSNHDMNDATPAEAYKRLISDIKKVETSDRNQAHVYAYTEPGVGGEVNFKVGTTGINGLKTKWGKQKDTSVEKRIKGTPAEQTADILFDIPVASIEDAKRIEAQFHGSQIQKKSLADFGHVKNYGTSGGTEFYTFKNQDELNAMMGIANDKISQLLSPQQKKIASHFESQLEKKRQSMMKKDEESGWLGKIGYGGLSTEGAMSFDDMLKDENTRKEYLDLYARLNGDDSAKMDSIASGKLVESLSSKMLTNLTGTKRNHPEKIRNEKDTATHRRELEDGRIKMMMSGITQNSAGFVRAIANEDDLTKKKKLRALYDIYKASDLDWGQVGKGTLNNMIDPVNALSGGASKLFSTVAKKAGMNQLAKSTIAKASVVGATEGTIFAGAEEKMNANADERDMDPLTVLTGTALGGLLGNTLGRLAHGTKKGRAAKEIAKVLDGGTENISTEAIEKIIKSAPPEEQREIREAIKVEYETNFKQPESKKKKTVKIRREDKLPLDIANTEHSEKSRFEAERASQSTLGEITSPEANPSIEQKPKRKILIKQKSNDAARRTYEEAHPVSVKTPEVRAQSTTVKIAPEEGEERLSTLMKAYDDNVELQKANGSQKMKRTGEYTKSYEEEQAHRIDFEIDQREQIVKELREKTGHDDMITEHMRKVEELEESRKELKGIEDSTTVKKQAEKEFYAQENVKIEHPSDEWIKSKERENQETFNRKEDFENKKGVSTGRVIPKSFMKQTYGMPQKERSEAWTKNVVDTIKRKTEDGAHEANKANHELKKRSGNSWNGEVIPEHLRAGNGKEIDIIENHWGRLHDMKQYETGEIKLRELAYRENKRLDAEIDALNNAKVDDIGNVTARIKKLQEQKENIGYHTKEIEVSNVEKHVKKEYANEAAREKAKAYAEEKHIESTTEANSELLNKLKTHTDKKILYVKNGKRIGERLVQKHFRDMMDTGLTPKEIADAYSPIAKNSDELLDLQVKRKEKMFKKAHDSTSKNKLGLNRTTSNDDRALKYNMYGTDASGSNLHGIAVLTGDGELAKKTSLGAGNADVRVDMAKTMTATNKFGEVTKDDIKDIMLPQLYSQGEAARIKTIMESRNMTEAQAKVFSNEYNKAMIKESPTLTDFTTNLQKKIKDGEIDAVVEFTGIDGTKHKVDLRATEKKNIRVGGRDVLAEVRTNDLERNARNLVTTIVQSVDGAAFRHIQKKFGTRGSHDEIMAMSRTEILKIEKEYASFMEKASSENHLERITKEIFGETPEWAKGKGGFKVDGRPLVMDFTRNEQRLKKKPYEQVNGWLKSEDDLLKEFMSKDNVFGEEYGEYMNRAIAQSAFMDRSIERAEDAIVDRMIAKAHNNFRITQSELIPPPPNQSLNKEQLGKWYKVQKQIFEEARIKIESNPLTRGDIRGELQYTDINGDPILNRRPSKTYQQVLHEQKKQYEKVMESMPPMTRTLLETKMPINPLSKEGWGSKAIKKQVELSKKVVEESAKIPSRPLKQTKEMIEAGRATFIQRQVGDSEAVKQFADLSSRRHGLDNQTRREVEAVQKELKRLIKEENINEDDMRKLIIESGYSRIRNLSQAEQDNFMRTHEPLLADAKKYIDVAVESIGVNENQTGWFRNSSREIAKELGYTKEADIRIVQEVLDTAIAIRSMTPKKKAILENVKGTKSLKYMTDLQVTVDKIGDGLFAHNPDKKMRFYRKESYEGMKKNDGTWDADSKRERGLINVDKEKMKIGQRVEGEYVTIPAEANINIHTRSEWAKKNNLKIDGDKGYRKIATEKFKMKKLGKQHSLVDELTGAYDSTMMKLDDRTFNGKVLKETLEDGIILSRGESKDMVRIPKDIKAALPMELEGVNYVHRDLLEPIFGRDEVRVVKVIKKEKDDAKISQMAKIADRVWSDLVMRQKQNVTLKNLSSFKNGFLYNWSILISNGANPARAASVMAKTIGYQREIKRLSRMIAKRKVQGRSTTLLEKKLDTNPLRIAEENNLAINLLDGTMGKDSLLNAMVGSKFHPAITSTANFVLLNQKSTTGRAMASLFSSIDTMGRMAMMDHLQRKEKLSVQEAARKANGYFADMNNMAPAWMELADKSGAAIFTKWYSNTAPSLIRMTKEHPYWTLSTAVALYALGKKVNMNQSGFSPIETLFDFPEQAITAPIDLYDKAKHPKHWEQLARQTLPYVIPKEYEKIYWEARRKGVSAIDWVKMVNPHFSKDWSKMYTTDKKTGKKTPLMPVDPRGMTQKIIEYLGG